MRSEAISDKSHAKLPHEHSVTVAALAIRPASTVKGLGATATTTRWVHEQRFAMAWSVKA